MDRPFGMLRSVTHGVDAPRSIKRGTVPRIWRFAAPYRRGLAAFLLFTVVSSVVGVITPILAGRVVDTIVARGDAAVAAATVVRAGRRDRRAGGRRGGQRARHALVLLPHRRGSDRRPAPSRVRARADDAGRVLHPHPHRGAGQQAQQRRDRRAVGDHLHAGQRGGQRHPADARRRRDDHPGLAGHGARAAAAADVRDPGAADGAAHRRPPPRGRRPQRRPLQPDDRALLRARRHPGEAVRPAGRRGRRVRRPRRADPRHRGAHRDGVAGVRHRAVAGVGAGPGADLRPRRRGWRSPGGSRRARSSPSRCCSPGSTRR